MGVRVEKKNGRRVGAWGDTKEEGRKTPLRAERGSRRTAHKLRTFSYQLAGKAPPCVGATTLKNNRPGPAHLHRRLPSQASLQAKSHNARGTSSLKNRCG
ncbi:hypothetical protein SLA2020_453920 [Shorea laevis]